MKRSVAVPDSPDSFTINLHSDNSEASRREGRSGAKADVLQA